MKEEFIPYEEALILKELGFDEECLSYYVKGGNEFKDWTLYRDGGTFFASDYPQYIGAPLYQQAFRWFREEYSLYHNIWNYTHGEPTDKIPYGFAFSIDEDWTCIVGKKEDGLFEKYYPTYEEAELECLKQLIKIVKEKK